MAAIEILLVGIGFFGIVLLVTLAIIWAEHGFCFHDTVELPPEQAVGPLRCRTVCLKCKRYGILGEESGGWLFGTGQKATPEMIEAARQYSTREGI